MSETLAITRNTQDLERLEGIIQKNIGAFYEVGRALMEIRDKKYYCEVLGFETFEAYCKSKWDFNRAHAYRLIDSAKVIDAVSPIGDIQPVTESQARPLARLEPDKQREAWQQAVDTAPDGKVTAAHVYKIVKGMTEGDTGKTENVSVVTEAMGIATFIISHLERIRVDDPKRDDALRRVLRWCNENMRKGE